MTRSATTGARSVTLRTDGAYQWKAVMMVPGREAESRWRHDALEFGTDPGTFTEPKKV